MKQSSFKGDHRMSIPESKKFYLKELVHLKKLAFLDKLNSRGQDSAAERLEADPPEI